MQKSDRKPKFLKDYAPPDYLIEEVALDVALAPKAEPRRVQSSASGPTPKWRRAASRWCSTAKTSPWKA